MQIDKNILEQFEKNPEKGFDLIVDTFQERVYWQIRRMVKNHEDTADIMQNVFIKVWRGLPNFRGESALYSWIYRIALNETNTFLTANHKRQSKEIDEPLFENGAVIEGKQYNASEIEKIFIAAIETLPEKQKLVFNLKYFDDLKFQEIEQMLGTSVGALKASYHLAVKKIEDYIKQY